MWCVKGLLSCEVFLLSNNNKSYHGKFKILLPKSMLHTTSTSSASLRNSIPRMSISNSIGKKFRNSKDWSGLVSLCLWKWVTIRVKVRVMKQSPLRGSSIPFFFLFFSICCSSYDILKYDRFKKEFTYGICQMA